MKRLIVMLSLLLWVVPVISAQDETTAACEIDLTSTVSLLVQAQGLAASGDTDRALAQIALARTKLEAFEAACGDVADVPVTPVVLELTQSYTLEDFNSSATFNYPTGWSITEDSGGALFASAPEILSRDFDAAPPALAPGEAAIFLQLGDGNMFGGGDTDSPSDLLSALSANIPTSFGEQSDITTFSVNDQPAALFTVSGQETDLMVIAAKLGDFDGETLFAQFILLSAPGELNAYEATLQAVAETIDLDR